MKSIRLSAIACIALTVVMGLGSLAFAQTPNSNDPRTAVGIDNQAHTIAASSPQWYIFNYAGDNSLITVVLVNGLNSGFEFNVYTPEQIADDWFNDQPIGRGTAQACGAQAFENNTCPPHSNDLIWTGRFPTPGTYYVQLVNMTNQPKSATLTVEGSGVGLIPAQASNPQPPPPTQTVPANQTQTRPTPQPTQPAGGTQQTASPNQPNTYFTDPFHALNLTNQLQTIPANSTIWYRFEYKGDGSNIRVALLNGVLNGLGFEVYTPAQVREDWWNDKPIGRGTAVGCGVNQPTNSNGEPLCRPDANDLVWNGSFPLGGTYFVRVVNNTPNAVQYMLTLDGNGVSICTTLGPNPQQNIVGTFLACP
ncbi:MAG TPA: hypothetical protein VFD70_19385 [Anaerolineae bacterium]|nr:hypothetical protein [Anaerolineae bacterium]